jgi:predicted ATPase
LLLTKVKKRATKQKTKNIVQRRADQVTKSLKSTRIIEAKSLKSTTQQPGRQTARIIEAKSLKSTTQQPWRDSCGFLQES